MRLSTRKRPKLLSALFVTIVLLMVFGMFKPKKASSSSSSSPVAMVDAAVISTESRLRGALWGFFAGDALSSPTHWYYGGLPQIQRDYGRAGITDYVKPVQRLSGSILNKSNINGGGRGSFARTSKGISIIGDVINHGKRDLWDPTQQIHYHATLQRGENTHEVSIARVLMKSIVANKGKFNADHFRNAYIEFMTTAGSHNDTYANTCHRMFFANLVLRKLDPKDCPDNDMHNVDTIDGLVLPTITALALGSNEEAAEDVVGNGAASTAGVTRKSARLEGASRVWAKLVTSSLHEPSNNRFLSESLPACAKGFGMWQMPSSKRPDQMTACYLDQSFPPALDMLAKYIPVGDAWTGLLANANVGGENVHRGSVIGAVLGARAGMENMPSQLRDGLYHHQELEKEINDFVKVVLSKKQ